MRPASCQRHPVFDRACEDTQMITFADIANELRRMMSVDPMRAERAVGAMYGGAFKRKESARNPWTHPDTGDVFRVEDPE